MPTYISTYKIIFSFFEPLILSVVSNLSSGKFFVDAKCPYVTIIITTVTKTVSDFSLWCSKKIVFSVEKIVQIIPSLDLRHKSGSQVDANLTSLTVSQIFGFKIKPDLS